MPIEISSDVTTTGAGEHGVIVPADDAVTVKDGVAINVSGNGASGIYSTGNITVDNRGSIQGVSAAITAAYAEISNAGYITGAINLSAGGTITNGSSGRIDTLGAIRIKSLSE